MPIVPVVVIVAVQICRAGWHGQRTLFTTDARQKERMPFVAHSLNLAQKDCVIAARILSRYAGIDKAHSSCEDWRACGCDVVASLAKVGVAFVRRRGKAIGERFLLLG